MSERGRFEAEEIAGMARQYGGRRVIVEPATKHFPAVMAWSFPSLCWCCPMWRRVELVPRPDADPADQSWQSVMCPHGCLSSAEDSALSKPCPTGLAGHAGYRDIPEQRPGEPHTAYVYPGPHSTKVARCSCGWEGTPQATAISAVKERDTHIGRSAPSADGQRGGEGHG